MTYSSYCYVSWLELSFLSYHLLFHSAITHTVSKKRDHRGEGAGRATAPPLFCLGLGLRDKYGSVQVHDECLSWPEFLALPV